MASLTSSLRVRTCPSKCAAAMTRSAFLHFQLPHVRCNTNGISEALHQDGFGVPFRYCLNYSDAGTGLWVHRSPEATGE